MKQKDSFVGFDFDMVWAIDSDTNKGFPYLKSLPLNQSNTKVTVVNADDFLFAKGRMIIGAKK